MLRATWGQQQLPWLFSPNFIHCQSENKWQLPKGHFLRSGWLIAGWEKYTLFTPSSCCEEQGTSERCVFSSEKTGCRDPEIAMALCHRAFAMVLHQYAVLLSQCVLQWLSVTPTQPALVWADTVLWLAGSPSSDNGASPQPFKINCTVCACVCT